MTTTNIYLTFNGDCLQAFEFYKSAFGGDFPFVGRYGDVPAGSMVIRDDEKEKIMHITFPISDETMLMGNDHLESFGPAPVKGCYLCPDKRQKKSRCVIRQIIN